MARKPRTGNGRKEPVFDATPAPDLQLGPADRSAGPGDPPRRRKPGKRGGGGKPARSKAGRTRTGVTRLAYWALVLSLWMVIAGVGAAAWVGAHLPPIQSLEIPKRPPSIQIVGLDARVLVTRGDAGGAVLSLKDLPPYLPQAFIAIEDRRFFSHYGVDPLGIARALYANVVRRGVSQGGSSITQQLAKNLFLTQERTVHRKLQELGLAFWLERKLTKTQILELYLNRVYFGSGAWGIEQAAQRYFGKPARQVTIAEAALLAGLVKSPSRLAPTRNFDAAERRAHVVLTAMAETGAITDKQAATAIANAPRITQQPGTGSINYVADWIMDVLDDLIGRVEEDIVVETSIDSVMQANAEKSLVDELALKGEKAGVAQGAIIAMTPEGAVRALVGGRSYGESQFNRAVAARRQPGSAFKAFVFLTALEHGLTPETLRDDKPVRIKGWQPENYTREYFGPVSLTRALAQSLNTVAVRLTQEFGPAAVIRTAHRLGIASKLEANASIALGTSEVSVLELTSAYAPFANGGLAVVPHVVERVRAAGGKTLYTRDPQPLGRIVDAGIVGMMNGMMQETLRSGTAHNAILPGWNAAGKTGTSQDFRDAWFVGYTPRLVTGVWLGNDDGTPTKKVTGGGLPVEIWGRFMRGAHQGIPIAALPSAPNGPGGASTGGGLFAPLANLVPVPRSGPTSAKSDGTLDGWLTDKLFGR